MTTFRPWGLALMLFVVLTPSISPAQAVGRCADAAGEFTSIDGEVEVQSASDGGWITVSTGQTVCEADTIRVGEKSRVAIRLANQAVLRLDQNSTLTLVNVSNKTEQWAWLDLSRGAFQSFSRAPWKVKVNTPYLKGLIDGTEFYVSADQGTSKLGVLEGRVRVENDLGRVTVEPGQEAVAQPGKAPYLQTVVRPRDAVQWGLYYPPVLAAFDGSSEQSGTGIPGHLLKAVELARQGQPKDAFNALEQIPQENRDAEFFLYRAALSLSLGRADEAAMDIESLLRQQPSSSLAYALLSIIAVVQNQREKALADADRAVSLQATTAARIAQSYAFQANFKLDAARDVLLAATRADASNALAWARLGELELMLGNRPEALAAAKRGTALSPSSSRAQWVLGYCALADYRNSEAKTAFQNAIAITSSDPMAHLGLGLAKISDGQLVEGRKDIETAVALDSNNALLRAYLGKAYFTEKRGKIDATQFQLAKELDPLDPTAYLYDGIRKQSENRPIEALHDLQKAKELNDNRSVYRGRLLLDQDRASRGISLARVYKDLGFSQTALREASVSLEDDPANASAHRFLSDSYQGVRRREIARVSELLQAQMLQDVNVNPIQPSIAETNLNIITTGGSIVPGFNEFTPLYERNSAKLDATGIGGSNGTFGGEGAVTALYDNFSFGAAGMHYQSDGWRPNNGLSQHLYNFFGQAAITSQLNVQAEYRHRESVEGDLAFNFDPSDFDREKTVAREQDMARFGLRFTPTAGSNFLFSYIHNHLANDVRNDEVEDIDLGNISADHRTSDEGDQFEGQYLFRYDNFNLIAGFTHSQVDRQNKVKIILDNFPIVFTDNSAEKITSTQGYLYSHFNLPASVTWTLGFNYADYEQLPINVSKFNPKFGVVWDVTKDFRLRAAVFRSVKPALVNNRTLEPTQIAGFNQLFDDINGIRSTRYGGGFDWHPTRDLSIGGEITWRELNDPEVLDNETAIFEHRKEELHSLYLYWTPVERLSLKAEFAYDRFWSQSGKFTENGNPKSVETFSAPLTLSYFDPTGWFARLGGTFVHQHVRRDLGSGQGNDSFFLVDTEVGYRFPKRRGLASVGVKNLFDTKFRYQDDSYREFRSEPSTGPYFPDRIIMGRLQLAF